MAHQPSTTSPLLPDPHRLTNEICIHVEHDLSPLFAGLWGLFLAAAS
jgi:hypothetical protein